MPIIVPGGTTTPPVVGGLALDDLKAHLNIALTSTRNDSELSGHLSTAIEAVSHLSGHVAGQAVTRTVETTRDGVAVLPDAPVQSVSSVLDAGGSAVSGFTTTRLESGLVDDIPGGRREVTVTYLTGRASLPASVRHAALVIAAHLWESQRLGRPGASPSQGFNPDSGETFVPSLGYAIPNQALQVLAPYRMAPRVG